jgi:prepilin peptidase CpaA
MPSAPAIAGRLQPAILAVAAFILGVASLNDIAVRAIPDVASIGLVLLGVAVRLVDGNAIAALVASAAILLLGAVCWRFGWLGGGDVKLLAACAWLVSPPLVPQLVLVTALTGGVLACLYLALSWMARAPRIPTQAAHPRTLAGRIWRAERWRIRRRASLPYGCAIAAATLITLSGW